MDEDELIRECARAVRPYLGELTPASAEELDRSLAEALNANAPTDVILEIFQAEPQLRAATTEAIAVHDFGGVMNLVSRLSGLPGYGTPNPTRYACPLGDFSWYRRKVGLQVPRCPTHDKPLVRSAFGE
jgi:hypothetical protein